MNCVLLGGVLVSSFFFLSEVVGGACTTQQGREAEKKHATRNFGSGRQ